MARGQKKKPAKHRSPIRWWRGLSNRWQWLTIIGVGVFAWGAVFATRAVLDIRKFKSLENTMTELSSRIERELGVSDIETEKYCDYSTQKYSRGPLGCRVRIVFPQETVTDQEIVTIIQEQNDLFYENYQTPYTVSHDFRCVLSHTRTDRVVYVGDVSCGGGATFALYPLRGE
jgi:hypothetical protein